MKTNPWSNACGRKGRVPQSSVIIETATLHAGTCMNKEWVDDLHPGFKLDPRSNACGRKDRVPKSSVIIETTTPHAGTCTRSRLITYILDLSNWIHGAIHVEERVEYDRPQ